MEKINILTFDYTVKQILSALHCRSIEFTFRDSLDDLANIEYNNMFSRFCGSAERLRWNT